MKKAWNEYRALWRYLPVAMTVVHIRICGRQYEFADGHELREPK